MLRVCARRNYLYRGMPSYRRLRTLHRVLWAWLHLVERRCTRTTAGLAEEVRRRRARAEGFSLLLVGGRDPACPRCCFARWLECVQRGVAQRAIVGLARKLRGARLLEGIFQAKRACRLPLAACRLPLAACCLQSRGLLFTAYCLLLI